MSLPETPSHTDSLTHQPPPPRHVPSTSCPIHIALSRMTAVQRHGRSTCRLADVHRLHRCYRYLSSVDYIYRPPATKSRSYSATSNSVCDPARPWALSTACMTIALLRKTRRRRANGKTTGRCSNSTQARRSGTEITREAFCQIGYCLRRASFFSAQEGALRLRQDDMLCECYRARSSRSQLAARRDLRTAVHKVWPVLVPCCLKDMCSAWMF